jgi:glycosyltransferase involved in cell wall biosynthesis
MASDPPLISVCILAGHGLDLLEACLASLADQVAAPRFELLIGGRIRPELLAAVRRHFPAAPVCDPGRRPTGPARNPLIERARGELLLFLDDDVVAPPDLLAQLARLAAEHPEASVFGGQNETPPGSSHFQVVQGAVLSSLVGSGPVSRRYGPRRPGFADERWFTLCNLAVRRRSMIPFHDDLHGGEENAVMIELSARGETMRYEPSLRVFHARRPTWRSFATQIVKYGRGRGQLISRQPETARVAFLMPVLVLVYLVALPGLLLLAVPPGLALAPGAAYLLLSAASAAWIGLTLESVAAVPVALALTFTVHACYGWGVLMGLPGSGQPDAHPPALWTQGPAHTHRPSGD